MEISWKNVLITGGTAWIGYGIAENFAKNWVNVIVSYFNNEERAKKVEEKLRWYGIKAYAIKADSADKSQLEALFSKATDLFWTINILVNNVWASFAKDNEISEWDSMFQHHMMSTVRATEWFETQLWNNQWNIINISSIAGIDPWTFYKWVRLESYCCIKAAINMYTKISANKFAGKIRVNAVAPGNTETEWWFGADEAFKKARADSILIKRFVKPEEIAQMVKSTVENEAMNWSIIVVDGGLVAKWYE